MQLRKAARAAVLAGKLKEAGGYYESLHQMMPEDREADWYYAIISLMVGITDDTPDQYAKVAEDFFDILKYVAAEVEDKEEKAALAYVLIKSFPPLKDIIHKDYISRSNGKNKEYIVNSLVKIETAPRIDKKTLPDEILDIFGEEEPYCRWAADLWKEQIAERFKWSAYRNFQDKGKTLWFDELGEKIKKYDPSYEMPQFKQAGCISSGDAGKVKPGQ